MDRSQISPALMKARGADIARIPLATMKVISSPGELAMRLGAYTALAAKAARPHLEPGLVRGYHQLAVEVLTTEDRARATELLKTAGTAPHYSPPEMQHMLRAGTACKLPDGHICPVDNVRDLRYQVTVAQGALGRGTPEDSAAFRSFLTSRARFLGAPKLIPQDWGRPAAASSAVAAGKSVMDLAVDAVRKAAGLPAGSLAKAGSELHPPFRGRHSHPHPDNGIRGNPGHEHSHVHDGDASHVHAGEHARIQSAAAGGAGKSAAAAGALAKAAQYEEKARRVSSPADRQAYLKLAQAERERAREQGDARAAKAAEFTSWAARRDLYGSLAKAADADRLGFPTLLMRGIR